MIVFPQDRKGTLWAGGQVHSEFWGYARGQKPGSRFFHQVQKHKRSKFRIWVEQVRISRKEETNVQGLRRSPLMGSQCPEQGRRLVVGRADNGINLLVNISFFGYYMYLIPHN